MPRVPGLLLAAVILGCATPPSAAGQGQGPAWPAPPAEARIRFVRSLDPVAMRGKPSIFSRALKALVGAGPSPKMTQPYGVAVGPDGRLYVADSAGGRIHVFGLDKPDYRSFAVDSESLIGIVFIGPRLIVTDSVGGRVLCLDQRGKTLWTLGRKDGLLRPTGVAVAGDRIFVVDTLGHRVVKVTPAGAILTTFGGRGVDSGKMNYPTHIATDAERRIYVTDAMNFRVQIFDGNGRHLSTFGKLGDGPGDFDKPKGIAVDATGHIYVVEGLNDVVQMFDHEGRLLLVFGGSGGGPGQLWLPAGIALAGNTVFVADTANHRVQVFERTGPTQ
jgi:DNA-binding beta-propeller fold protein YncE